MYVCVYVSGQVSVLDGSCIRVSQAAQLYARCSGRRCVYVCVCLCVSVQVSVLDGSCIRMSQAAQIYVPCFGRRCVYVRMYVFGRLYL